MRTKNEVCLNCGKLYPKMRVSNVTYQIVNEDYEKSLSDNIIDEIERSGLVLNPEALRESVDIGIKLTQTNKK